MHSLATLRTDGPLARRHRVRLCGAGPQLVVLSHGLGTDQSAWAGIWPALARQHRVLLYDLPGAGPLLPDDFNPRRYAHLSAYADDLMALLDEIGVQRCTFVGHSVSGMVGALAAVADPDRFGQMILLNASPRYLNAQGYVGGFTQQDLAGLYHAMETQYESWVAGFAPAAIGDDVPEAVARFTAGFMAMRPDVTLAVAKAIFESDLRAVLPRVQAPVVLVHTRRDIAVPEQVAHYMAAHLPHARIEWIDAQGHLPHLSAPEEVTAVLTRHLSPVQGQVAA